MERRFILLVSSVAALGGLLFGYDTAIISGAIPHITLYFHLDGNLLGWAVSCILIGCAGGAMMAGPLSDRWGRRTVLFICAALFAISGIGAGLAQDLYGFIIFRCVGGLGVGAAAMVSPMYIAETAPDNRRGTLVSLYQLAIVLGILLAYFAGYLFAGVGENNWRWMFISQAAPSLLFGLMLLLVPETPRWLVMKGRKDRALKVLTRIAGQQTAGTMVGQIEASFQQERGARLRELFSGRYVKVLVVGILVAVFQQVTGINAILYYAPVIFKATGLDTSSAVLQTIGIGLVNVAATFIAIGLVDKVGRKRFLLVGALVMGLSLLVVSACFYYKYFGHYIVLLSMLVYVGAFGCTLGAVTWVYLSEIFPNRIRALAMSVATLALWLADFLVADTFPMMTERLGTSATLLVYALCCVLAFLFVLFKVPETRGRSLEEIGSLFINK
jgi:SP family arabinose:H+ symporter-like MFS transporter